MTLNCCRKIKHTNHLVFLERLKKISVCFHCNSKSYFPIGSFHIGFFFFLEDFI